MPFVYTQWVDAHCCLPLNTFCNLPDFNRSEENVENVFLNYDRPSHGLLPSRRLIASHPQQDNCKSTKKNWDLQENRKVSCKSQIKLVIKQHIFKAFALTGRRRDNVLIPRVLPWARCFCPLPFRYAPVTVGSGRAAVLQ